MRRELEIAASPETVWEFLVDPAKARTWWGQAVTFDPRPGAPLRIEVTPGSISSGEVLEVDPPHRLVYTWGWEVGGGGPELIPPGSTTVEIDLIPVRDGTTLRLAHRGLPGDEAMPLPRGGLGPLPRPVADRRRRGRPGARPVGGASAA